jgi:hypothetical protein
MAKIFSTSQPKLRSSIHGFVFLHARIGEAPQTSAPHQSGEPTPIERGALMIRSRSDSAVSSIVAQERDQDAAAAAVRENSSSSSSRFPSTLASQPPRLTRSGSMVQRRAAASDNNSSTEESGGQMPLREGEQAGAGAAQATDARSRLTAQVVNLAAATIGVATRGLVKAQVISEQTGNVIWGASSAVGLALRAGLARQAAPPQPAAHPAQDNENPPRRAGPDNV